MIINSWITRKKRKKKIYIEKKKTEKNFLQKRILLNYNYRIEAKN